MNARGAQSGSSSATSGVGDRLRDHKEEITQRWMELARATVPPARGCDDETLRDSLPAFLDVLADELDQRAVEQAASEVSRLHAEQRLLLPGYRVEDVVLEYRLLRKTLFECLEAEGPTRREERDRLHEAIDAGIGQAGAAFMRAHLSRTEGSIRALESDRARRTQFVSALAHDLRSPLSAARLAIQRILRHPDLPDLLRGTAVKGCNNIDRVDGMIRDLLDANRIRAGERLPIDLEECELVEVVREVIDDLAALHGARFELEAEAPIRGYWSKEGIRRMVENLAINAVKYGAAQSPVSIAVASERETVSLSVHNEGEPLSKEEQSRLFEAFHRSKKAEGSGQSGWGLGLTLVRGVAEAHGGRAEVRSLPGQGVTFVVTLPRDCRRFQA